MKLNPGCFQIYLGAKLLASLVEGDLTVEGSVRWDKMDEQAERRTELKRGFSDFLDQDHGLGEYPDKIKALLTKEAVAKNRLRLEVDIHDLQKFNNGLYRSLLTDPGECIQPFEDALDELVKNAYPKLLQVRLCLEECLYRLQTTARPFCAAKFCKSAVSLCNVGRVSLIHTFGHVS